MTTQSPDQSVTQSQGDKRHDWPEDFSHENGNYLCQCLTCGVHFQGHKRRVTCKWCSTFAPSPAPSKEIPQSEVMYRVYARYKGTSEWIPQESSENKEDVLYWAQRNNERNAKTFEEGAGREYIAVKETRTYELL